MVRIISRAQLGILCGGSARDRFQNEVALAAGGVRPFICVNSFKNRLYGSPVETPLSRIVTYTVPQLDKRILTFFSLLHEFAFVHISLKTVTQVLLVPRGCYAFCFWQNRQTHMAMRLRLFF
jgi:hypothetical protein